MSLTAQPQQIPDVLLLEPDVFEDERGHFYESWNQRAFAIATGLHPRFVQDNQSASRRGVIRGLHYQLPGPQGKLVRVIAGQAFTVAVDIRASSPTFGQWTSAELSSTNRLQLWIPSGFAHGFMAMDDPTEILYKVTEFYQPEFDRVVRWDDPAIGVQWPLADAVPVLSAKDAGAPLLAAATVFD